MQGFYCIYPPIYSTKSDRATYNFKGNSASHFVGYNTIAVPANRLYAQGVQFTDVSGIDEIPVKDVLTVDNPVSATGFGDSADQIWLYNTSTMSWVKYYYKHTGRGSSKKVVGWVNQAVDGAEETTDTMKNGDAFFFRRAIGSGCNITLSGAIKATNADPVTLTANRLHFVCNPWPVSIKIASIANMISAPVSATGFGDSADQIWLYNTSTMGWEKYYYKHTGRGSSKKVIGWVKDSVDGTEETTDEIDVGRGFFFRRAIGSGATLTWVKPAGL